MKSKGWTSRGVAVLVLLAASICALAENAAPKEFRGVINALPDRFHSDFPESIAAASTPPEGRRPSPSCLPLASIENR
jgi:hypothetical protein